VSTPHNPLELCLELCRRHLDPHAQPLTPHTGHDQTNLLQAATRHGQVIIKLHRSRDRHNQERDEPVPVAWTPTVWGQ
jgi:hypothetical protein